MNEDTPKRYRAAEKRWRFIGVNAYPDHFLVGLQDRTTARRFAEWVTGIGAARTAELRDENGEEAGEGWASP